MFWHTLSANDPGGAVTLGTADELPAPFAKYLRR
jgi:hypothetical protein